MNDTDRADGAGRLVVAGAGGGVVAALRAAQLGREVVLVEANEHFTRGNNTSMSTAMIPGAGSTWQAAAGIEDGPETFFADMLAKTHGEVDPVLGRALAEVSARLVTWLADDLGLPMSLVTDFPYPGHSRLRCHTVPGRSGATLLRLLVDAVNERDTISMLAPAKLTGVRRDAHGAVCAAEVTTPDGAVEEIPADAVLLATNGFGASAELVEKYAPEIAGAVYHGSAESAGDALRIGRALGADLGYLDAYQGHAALATPAMTLLGWATVMHGGYVVDDGGRRFGDETVGYSEYARELLAHSDGRATVVYDQSIYDECMLFDDFRQTAESGAAKRADTLAELAEQVGIDAPGLLETSAAIGAAIRGEQPDRFGRRHFERELRAPFVATRVSAALFHTQGGLRVDEYARVLDESGRPIAGLYASGGAAMGISGHGASGYLAGNGLLAALGLAFVAAEHYAAP